MKTSQDVKVSELIQKGVQIPNPQSVQIGKEVDCGNISGKGVTIHAGCKIFGKSTVILQGAQLGYEAPVTIEDCQIGPRVELKGGFFKGSVFLEKAKMGFGAHVRDATILEEQASGAHTVALKQTILFPFVTLGSLINFCDCLMSGGTSRKDHSEVGSSYIHFNFTPNQDKATASLIGDVPQGVMLKQPPIFLGGQGGLVGPSRLAFGTTIAAGTIYRRDELRPGRLIFGGAGKGGNISYTPGRSPTDKRIIKNNLVFIANLYALRQWYVHVRPLFVSDDFPRILLQAATDKIDLALHERIGRLKDYCLKISTDDTADINASDPRLTLKKGLSKRWPELRDYLNTRQTYEGNTKLRDDFLETLNPAIKNSDKNYIAAITSLTREKTTPGTGWLQGIVDQIAAGALEILGWGFKG